MRSSVSYALSGNDKIGITSLVDVATDDFHVHIKGTVNRETGFLIEPYYITSINLAACSSLLDTIVDLSVRPYSLYDTVKSTLVIIQLIVVIIHIVAQQDIVWSRAAICANYNTQS
jgi:hypothetical protein